MDKYTVAIVISVSLLTILWLSWIIPVRSVPIKSAKLIAYHQSMFPDGSGQIDPSTGTFDDGTFVVNFRPSIVKLGATYMWYEEYNVYGIMFKIGIAYNGDN
jgi:hypothetical protein